VESGTKVGEKVCMADPVVYLFGRLFKLNGPIEKESPRSGTPRTGPGAVLPPFGLSSGAFR